MGECYYDSEAFAEGEAKIRRATRRVDESSRKLRNLAERIEKLKRATDARLEADRDAERPVAR